MTQPAALFMGTCSGHGKANGVVWHPGPGGGFANPCPHASLAPQIVPKGMPIADNFATWAPWPQQPTGPIIRNVVINNLIPIIDQDDLIPHPTFTQHITMSVGFKCFTVRNTPAWHCTVGTAGGREASSGHARRLFATTKTVFINGRRAGRFADPFGNFTVPFPCLSVVSGSSKNVFIGG
tara:strand:+ start:6549 stop:7088 length:540 start_codon:yes stop_codon:yes gene_type:complete